MTWEWAAKVANLEAELKQERERVEKMRAVLESFEVVMSKHGGEKWLFLKGEARGLGLVKLGHEENANAKLASQLDEARKAALSWGRF